MITLLAAIIGFLSSSLPHILNYYQDKQDKAHELAQMDKQIELQKSANIQALQEVQIQAQSAELQSIHMSEKPTGTWIDALNASVRPMIAYGMFFQYVLTRVQLYRKLALEYGDYNFLLETFHDNQDMAIFSIVITYYFGNRYFEKKFS